MRNYLSLKHSPAFPKLMSWNPRTRGLIAFSSVIMVIFGLILAYQARESYEEAIVAGQQDGARLTRILGGHVELTFHAADLSLRRAIDRSYMNELFGSNLPQDLESNLHLWITQSPQIAAMVMADAHGVVRSRASKRDYAFWLADQQSVRGEAFFKSMQDAADAVLQISLYNPPAEEAPNTPALLVITRRLSRLDGSFGGIVAAAINPHYFVDFLTSIDQGKHSTATVLLAEGRPLISGPGASAEALRVTQEIGAETQRLASPGIITSTKVVDGSLKIVSAQQLQAFPVIVSVALDEEDFLAGWRSDRIKDIGFLAIFAIFGSVLSFFALTMAKQIRRVEESEQAAILANQAKSEFLANMSHELRTPLNAIIGFSEMMDAGYFGPLSPKQQERIHDIHLCGNHLLQLINDILEFSKGEAGKLELQEEDFSPAEVIRECIRIMSEKAKMQGLRLTAHMEKQTHSLYADKRKVRQILLNLITNAIKFTPRGGRISVSFKVDADGRAILRVIDTGVGIAADDIPKALSVFGQVNRNRSHEGTGLGLPLCRMFAELHGGELILESEIGKGTSVTVIFPRGRAHFRKQETLSLEEA